MRPCAEKISSKLVKSSLLTFEVIPMGFQFWGKIDFLDILHYIVYYKGKEKSSIILNFCYSFLQSRDLANVVGFRHG